MKLSFTKNLSKDLPEAAGVLGGTLAGNYVNSFAPNIDPRFIAAGKILLGFAVKNNKSAIVKGAGYGLISNGATELYQSFTAASTTTTGVPTNVTAAVNGGI